MKLDLCWWVWPGEPGDEFAIVNSAAEWIGTVANEDMAERIVAAHNATVFRMEEELRRIAWLAEANHKAWLAAIGQNDSGKAKTHDPVTGSDSRPAMRHSALGRS